MNVVTAPKIGAQGELLPISGFSRKPTTGLPTNQSVWQSHDGLIVVSSREDAYLPGSGEPPAIGPQWLVSVSRRSGGPEARCRATAGDVERVVVGFAMPAFDEDNHHPGVARHLWCPIDERYRSACECKLTEITIVAGDNDEYRWTTDSDGDCRGCEYRRLFGPPCPIHGGADGVRP